MEAVFNPVPVPLSDITALEPLHNRVLIKLRDPDLITKSGIHLPGTTKTRGVHRGTVIETGPGTRLDSGRYVPISCKAGDEVLVSPFAINEQHDFAGGKCVLAMEHDVLAVIVPDA